MHWPFSATLKEPVNKEKYNHGYLCHRCAMVDFIIIIIIIVFLKG